MLLLTIPLTFFLFVAYNAIVFYWGPQSLFAVVFSVELPSQVNSDLRWNASTADVLLAIAFVCLYVEIFKATRTSRAVILDHGLSIAVFVMFLVEFLLMPEAGTSLFFHLMMVAMIDVIAGLTVTLTGARRDFNITGS